MTAPKTITADEAYYASVTCPQCGADEVVPVTILARLTKTRDDSKLGVKVAQKSQEHKCGQTSLTVMSETGEIVQLGLGDVR
jgi:predicted RNA-binding Zn-ribbon protein involved in translation (DUF1610 family)